MSGCFNQPSCSFWGSTWCSHFLLCVCVCGSGLTCNCFDLWASDSRHIWFNYPHPPVDLEAQDCEAWPPYPSFMALCVCSCACRCACVSVSVCACTDKPVRERDGAGVYMKGFIFEMFDHNYFWINIKYLTVLMRFYVFKDLCPSEALYRWDQLLHDFVAFPCVSVLRWC